jgi:EF-P beta-lysylation protein EpmB
MSGWQKKLAEGFSSASDLLLFLGLPKTLADESAHQQFKTRVPRAFAEKMLPGDPSDPLLLQVLPVQEEMQVQGDFVKDPLQESSVNPLPGLIHKYRGRVLLTVAGACAINCRYCFRRHFPYQDNNPGRGGWQPVLDYIQRDPSIHEVILSGGDPLLAADGVLDTLFHELSSISHIRTLRIHTRLPVVLPERVHQGLIDCLKALPLSKVVVLHINHPNEIDIHLANAVTALKHAGCHVLNQSVLLASVNDSSEVLAHLSEKLFSAGILPYYLHLLDKVQGARHFEVLEKDALAIFQRLQEMLPGYLVPRLAKEGIATKSKTLIC